MANPLDLHRAVDRLPTDIFFWKAEERENWNTESHWHGSGQLFALDNGSAAVAVGGASWLLLPGRVGWIPPHDRHSMTSHGSVSGWSLYLPAHQAASLPKHSLLFLRSGLVEQIVVRLAHWRQSKPDARALGRLLSVLADEMSVSPPESTFLPLPRDLRLVEFDSRIQPESGCPPRFGSLGEADWDVEAFADPCLSGGNRTKSREMGFRTFEFLSRPKS